MNGFRLLELETEVLAASGLSPKPVVAPPKVGSLAFEIIGGVPKLLKPRERKEVELDEQLIILKIIETGQRSLPNW